MKHKTKYILEILLSILAGGIGIVLAAAIIFIGAIYIFFSTIFHASESQCMNSSYRLTEVAQQRYEEINFSDELNFSPPKPVTYPDYCDDIKTSPKGDVVVFVQDVSDGENTYEFLAQSFINSGYKAGNIHFDSAGRNRRNETVGFTQYWYDQENKNAYGVLVEYRTTEAIECDNGCLGIYDSLTTINDTTAIDAHKVINSKLDSVKITVQGADSRNKIE